MRSLLESLLLLALDDRKGLVHSTAFLAIDHGLRGACFAELRQQGLIVTRGGEVQRTDRPLLPTGSRLLDSVAATLVGRGTLAAWLQNVGSAFPRIRATYSIELEERRVLRRATGSGGVLPGITTTPLADPAIVKELREQLAEAVRMGDPIKPREGTLIGLVVVCNLARFVFPPELEAEARRIAGFVAEKDSIVRAVRVAVLQAEGNE